MQFLSPDGAWGRVLEWGRVVKKVTHSVADCGRDHLVSACCWTYPWCGSGTRDGRYDLLHPVLHDGTRLVEFPPPRGDSL